MIHASQVQYTMQHEDANFIHHIVPKLLGLVRRALHRNREFSQRVARSFDRKRQDIGSLILPPEVAIESAQTFIVGNQATERTSVTDAV